MPAHKFTLIELLAVLVLALIMTGIALPAFKTLTAEKGVDSGVRIIAGQLRLARQYSLTQRRRIAAIMPTDQVGEENQFSCFRLAAVEPGISSATFEFNEWVADGKWFFLPPGCTIMEVDTDKGIQTGGVFQADPVDDACSEVWGDSTSTTGVPLDLSTIGGPANIGSADAIRSVVFSPTGKALGDGPANVTVGSATYTGNNWIIRSPANLATNKSCANQFNIEVDRYTGRVSIETPEEY